MTRGRKIEAWKLKAQALPERFIGLVAGLMCGVPDLFFGSATAASNPEHPEPVR